MRIAIYLKRSIERNKKYREAIKKYKLLLEAKDKKLREK